jgi:hypothetical protein
VGHEVRPEIAAAALVSPDDWYDLHDPEPQRCPACQFEVHCEGHVSFCECACTVGSARRIEDTPPL